MQYCCFFFLNLKNDENLNKKNELFFKSTMELPIQAGFEADFKLADISKFVLIFKF